MGEHFINSLLRADSQLLIFAEQPKQKMLEVGRQIRTVLGKGNLLVQGRVVDILRLCRVEGWQTCDQLVEECSDRVEVHEEGVTSLGDHFRRHVLWTSAEGVGACVGGVNARLGQPEVSDVDMSLPVNEYVLWLEVAVDDPIAMYLLQSEQDLDHVESSNCFLHLSEPLDQSEEFAPRVVLQDEHQLALALEGGVQPGQQRMVQFRHYVPLVHHDFLLLVTHGLCLVDHLHRVELAIVLEPAQVHS